MKCDSAENAVIKTVGADSTEQSVVDEPQKYSYTFRKPLN
jgi:hypothetical protein